MLSWPTRLITYFKSVIHEAQRVTWPTRRQTIQLTSIVVGVVVIFGGLLAAVDYGLAELLELLIS